MSNIIQGAQVRLLSAGIKVSRATAALPAGVLGNIFTITGGRILVVALVGEVTTVIGGTAMTMTIGTAPTVGTGSASALGTASSALATAAVGTHLGINPGGAVVADVATQAGVSAPAAMFIADPGSITITPSATNTGSVKWDLIYIPLDDNAAVAAA